MLSAVHGGHTAVAKLLLEAGADVDEQSVTCGSSLEIAAAQGDLETVRLLLDLGANINQKGIQCTNALQASSAHGHVEVVQHLLDRGANIYTNTLDQLPSGSGAPASEGNDRLRNEQPNVREHANMQTQPRNPPQFVEISEGPTDGPNLELDGAQRRLQSRDCYESQQIAATSPAPLHSGHEFHESRHQPLRLSVSEESLEAQSPIDNESFEYLAQGEGETIGTMRNAFDEHHNGDNLFLKQYHIGSLILPRWDPFSEGPGRFTEQIAPLPSLHDAMGLRDRQDRGISMLLQADTVSQKKTQPTPSVHDPGSPSPETLPAISQAESTKSKASESEQERSSPPPLPFSPSGRFECTHPGCSAPPFQTQYLLKRVVQLPTAFLCWFLWLTTRFQFSLRLPPNSISHSDSHSVVPRPHFCPIVRCPRSKGGIGFKRKNEMIRHQLVHMSPGYSCPYCPDREHRYPRPDGLQRCGLETHRTCNKDTDSLIDMYVLTIQTNQRMILR